MRKKERQNKIKAESERQNRYRYGERKERVVGDIEKERIPAIDQTSHVASEYDSVTLLFILPHNR